MKGSRLLFVASWVILLVLAIFVALASFGSLGVAYRSNQDQIAPAFTLEEVRSIGGEEAVKAIQGRRATAATWALGYALLAAWVVVVPYRRGERWAWWALLISLGLSQLISIARVPLIGGTQGAGTSGIVLAFLLLGLLAGAPRIFSGGHIPALDD